MMMIGSVIDLGRLGEAVKGIARRQIFSNPLKKSLCRRGRAIVAEDKTRDRRESLDSGRERLPAAGR